MILRLRFGTDFVAGRFRLNGDFDFTGKWTFKPTSFLSNFMCSRFKDIKFSISTTLNIMIKSIKLNFNFEHNWHRARSRPLRIRIRFN